MMRYRKNKTRNGTASVEMAFVAPVIFIMIFGQIEFARLMMVRQAATNASREACRHACLISTRNSEDAKTVACNMIDDVIGKKAADSLVEIIIEPEFEDGLATGETIKTTIAVDFDGVSWLPPFFTKGTRIRSSMEMKRE